MPSPSGNVSKYGLRRASGHADVYETGTGKNRNLGPHASDESLRRYQEFLAELHEARAARDAGVPVVPPGAPRTIAETLLAYFAFARTYYVGPEQLPNTRTPGGAEAGTFRSGLKGRISCGFRSRPCCN